MFEEITPEQHLILEHAFDDLAECYRAKLKSSINTDERAVLSYAINVIQAHMALYDLKFDKFVRNHEAYYHKKTLDK